MHKTKLSPRRLARSLAIQGLYYFQTNPKSVSEIEDFLYSCNQDLYARANYQLLHSLLEVSCNGFNQWLNNYHGYSARPLAEIQLVEKAILVVAAVELTDSLSVPAPVVINEAIELAKIFGGEESFRFINGLVDKLACQLRPVEMQRN